MLMQPVRHAGPDPALEQLAAQARSVADGLATLASLSSSEGPGFIDPPSRQPEAEQALAAMARGYLKVRRLRESMLGADLFSDPAWDLLLDLFASEVEGKRVCVSSATIAANVPATTGLRWLELLMKHHLAVRHRDESDGRRSFVKLTPRAKAAIASWLETAFKHLP
jgi:hypothetical protein